MDEKKFDQGGFKYDDCYSLLHRLDHSVFFIMCGNAANEISIIHRGCDDDILENLRKKGYIEYWRREDKDNVLYKLTEKGERLGKELFYICTQTE